MSLATKAATILLFIFLNFSFAPLFKVLIGIHLSP